MAEGHLETSGHGEAAETAEQGSREPSSSDQSSSSRHMEESSSRTQEVNADIELQVLLICLIQPWAEAEWLSPSSYI